eukprot:scaffold12240_cov170-Amphora_coffeaeformis.AAC.2
MGFTVMAGDDSLDQRWIMSWISPLNKLCGNQDHGRTINNACMGFEAGSAFVRACLDEAFGDLRLGKWGWQGPGLISRVHGKNGWNEGAILGPE